MKQSEKWKHTQKQVNKESDFRSSGGAAVPFKSQQATIQVGRQDQKGTG